MGQASMSPRSVSRNCTKMSQTPCTPSCTSAGMSTHSPENLCSRLHLRLRGMQKHHMGSQSKSLRSVSQHYTKMFQTPCTRRCTWAGTSTRSPES